MKYTPKLSLICYEYTVSMGDASETFTYESDEPTHEVHSKIKKTMQESYPEHTLMIRKTGAR